MDHEAEHGLYISDRAAWAQYVATRWAKMLRESDETRRRELWKLAGQELRAAIKALEGD
jgi:hypothetical protein